MPSKIVRETIIPNQTKNNLDLNHNQAHNFEFDYYFFKAFRPRLLMVYANMAYVDIHYLKLKTTSTLFQIHPINDERS